MFNRLCIFSCRVQFNRYILYSIVSAIMGFCLYLHCFPGLEVRPFHDLGEKIVFVMKLRPMCYIINDAMCISIIHLSGNVNPQYCI